MFNYNNILVILLINYYLKSNNCQCILWITYMYLKFIYYSRYDSFSSFNCTFHIVFVFVWRGNIDGKCLPQSDLYCLKSHHFFKTSFTTPKFLWKISLHSYLVFCYICFPLLYFSSEFSLAYFKNIKYIYFSFELI